MSVLKELSIQGIRSFGPENPQRVTFSTPVTLILGPNGTGKTTIIECLKYAATGELPPGAKTGASFIYDPKLAHSYEVKAKVAMKIRDTRNMPVIVTRCLSATQKDTLKQASLKTLDGSIQRQLPNGEIASISSRCTEIDREMATCLGASKAVFENVIFCHQEESNWPLQEAKSVKERFDDLFASSRYVKALDAIRRTKLEQECNLKVYKGEIKHLGQRKETADQVRNHQLIAQKNLNTQETKLADVNEKLNPILAELTLYRQKYTQLIEYQSNARSCENEKAVLEKFLRDLSENITNEFEGSDEQLREAIEQAEIYFVEKQQSILDMSGKLDQNRLELEKNESKRSKLLIKKTRLESEINRLEEATRKRNEFLKQLAVDLGLTDFYHSIGDNGVIESSAMNIFNKKFEAAVKTADRNFQQARSLFEKEERKAQSTVDEARSSVVTLEQSIVEQNRSLKENTQEKAAVEAKLTKASCLSAELYDVKSKLEQVCNDLRCIEKSTEIADGKKTITDLEVLRSKYEGEIESLDAQINEAHRIAMANHERDQMKKTRQAAIDTAIKLRNRHLDVLEQIFSGDQVPQIVVESEQGKDASRTLPQQFRIRLESLTKSTKASQQELNKLQDKKSSLKASLSFQRITLRDKQKVLQEHEERLLAACGNTDVESHLDKLLIRKKQLESDYANCEGSLYLLKKFKRQLAHDSECPLCHRSFDNENDYRDLETEVHQRITSMPLDFEANRKELEEVVKKYEILLQLKPVAQEFTHLLETEVPNLKKQVADTTNELDALTVSVEEEASKLELTQAYHSIAQSLQGDIAVIAKSEIEIADLNQSLRQFTSIYGESGTKSLSELQSERDYYRKDCLALSKKIDETRNHLDIRLAERQEAINKQNKLRDLSLKLQKDFQDVSIFSLDLDRLSNLCSRIAKNVEELNEKLPVYKARLADAEQIRRDTVKELEHRVLSSQEEIKNWRERERQLNEMCILVTSGSFTNIRQSFTQTNEELLELESEISRTKVSTKSMSDAIEILRFTIANHKIYQRELQDCVRLRDKRSELSLLNMRFREIQRKITECQLSSCLSGTTDLEEKISRLSEDEDMLRQQKKILSDKITQFQTELRMHERELAELYADAESEYLKKVYQLKTAEMASTDLQRYYRALDAAIMSYHASKMAEVNQIIRDLWRTTYRGNDIDFIEICSEVESTSVNATATSSSARRTYNYRVVMVKNVSGVPARSGAKQARISTETRLDMRGRCSAGQKVLASLVIRLALAEVFCIQCGVLALDEPTTNLDRDNIVSLAFALTEIIKTRSVQRNFQLIVITHDEDFIELLGRADCVGHLLRISRSQDGLSEIEKIRIEDQFH